MNFRPTSVFVLSELLADPGEPWFRDASMPVLRTLAERSEIFPLQWRRSEAEILGLNPDAYPVAEGPLTVSSLGFDPPTRSVQFRVSALTTDAGTVREPRTAATPEELEILGQVGKRLSTPTLTFLSEGTVLALVWEPGSLELGTTPPTDLKGRSWKEILPEGDGETTLRRFIDDSVNLLHEQEFNLRRREEGLDPIDVLWPWGQGMPVELPNLPLARGRTANFASSSVRLDGLTRLARYRHAPRAALGRGTTLKFEWLVDWTKKHERSIAWITEPGDFRQAGGDEMHAQYEWILREMDARLIAPLAEQQAPPVIAVLAPGRPGLGFIYDPERPERARLPFDERALEEPEKAREFSDVMNALLS